MCSSSGSSRVVAGGVASSSSTSSSSSACYYDEELYFKGRTVLSSACGVTMKRYTCSERVVAAEYCRFSSGGHSNEDSDSDDDAADSGSRDSSGSADEALAILCESSLVSLCPGSAAVECPLDRRGRDRAWRLPRGCGLLLSCSSSSSSGGASPPNPAPPVVLSHPMEEPATLPAIRYGEGKAEEGEGEAELGDLGGETVLFAGRLLPGSSGASGSAPSAPLPAALGDRIELRDTGWFAVTTRRSDAASSSSPSAATTTTTLWALSRCSAKAAAAAAAQSRSRSSASALLPVGAAGSAPQNYSTGGGAFASTPGGGAAAVAAAARRGAAVTPRTPAGAPAAAAATTAATVQQLGLSPTAAATARAAAMAAATQGKGRRCAKFVFSSSSLFLPLLRPSKRESRRVFVFLHALSCSLSRSLARSLSLASQSTSIFCCPLRDRESGGVVGAEQLVLLPDLGVAHQVDVRLHGFLFRHARQLRPVVVLRPGLEGEETGPVALDVADGGLVGVLEFSLRRWREVGVEKKGRVERRVGEALAASCQSRRKEKSVALLCSFPPAFSERSARLFPLFCAISGCFCGRQLGPRIGIGAPFSALAR